MMQVSALARRTLWLGGPLLVLLAVSSTACHDGASLASSEGPPPVDTTPPPPPPDTTPPPPPPPDTTTPPPPDTTTPPPGGANCGPMESSGPPVHVGLPIGPTHVPPADFGNEFSGTQISGIFLGGSSCLLPYLAAARKANVRVFINLTGNEQYLRDANGFSMTKWKARVDRFRNEDITPYIQDGTILAHLIMDEPNDRSNWSGQVVSHADIEEMARYSKELWPGMPTYIRTLPAYLKGGSFPHLDALWFHYVERFGPIDNFIATNFAGARALGLKIISGLNVLNGGSASSGIPGKKEGKYAMNADELRSWGGKLLSEPDQCAFLLWEWEDGYLSRPEIKAALEDLNQKARNYPHASCSK